MWSKGSYNCWHSNWHEMLRVISTRHSLTNIRLVSRKISSNSTKYSIVWLILEAISVKSRSTLQRNEDVSILGHAKHGWCRWSVHLTQNNCWQWSGTSTSSGEWPSNHIHINEYDNNFKRLYMIFRIFQDYGSPLSIIYAMSKTFCLHFSATLSYGWKADNPECYPCLEYTSIQTSPKQR